MILDSRNNRARGYLLAFVFYVHALYLLIASMADPASTGPAAAVQIKLLAPHVTAFFFFSGFGAQALGRRDFRSVLQQSLMLLMVSWLTHIVGFLLAAGIYGGYSTPRSFVVSMVKPMILGTNDATFVAWFFSVLAVARMGAWLFERSKPGFALAAGMASAFAAGTLSLGLPDNIYEWRNWPLATLFFILGMKFPRDRRIGAFTGLSGLALALGLAWFNRPGLLATGPCLACDLSFVAQPMVGLWGSLPVFLVQAAAFCLFLLWVSQLQVPPLSTIATTIGTRSLQLLVVHGWVMAATFPFLSAYTPARENFALLLAIFVIGPCIYLGLYLLLRWPVDRAIAACMAIARWISLLGAPKSVVRRAVMSAGN